MNSHFIPTCACISYEMPNWLPGLAYTVPISSELLRGKARGWGMEGGGGGGGRGTNILHRSGKT